MFADGYASADEQAVMMTTEEQARQRRGIGARVKTAREARGYTTAQLAEHLSVKPAFVASAEQGEVDIPLYQLMHVAELLMVGLDRLVAGAAPDEMDAA
nr:helix-turn-helix transcriptional regulator [Bradyrhizobium frederickii]